MNTVTMPKDQNRFLVNGLMNNKDNVQSLLYARDEKHAQEQFTTIWTRPSNKLVITATEKID
jgi:hypothetical protein